MAYSSRGRVVLSSSWMSCLAAVPNVDLESRPRRPFPDTITMLPGSGPPMITITDPTPQKTPDAHATPAVTPSNARNMADAQYRLLYRGALSLPDSYVQLDGIAFSARLPGRAGVRLQDSPSCGLARAEGTGTGTGRELMYNPLALALESMRGRTALRWKGTVRLQDVWMDDGGEVYMDIHPFATLTRIYFENILCLSALDAPAQDRYGPRRTEVGVRVSLGNTDGPETTDIVIFGETSTLLHPPPMQLASAATSSSAGPPPLCIRVARITPVPRAPRPDDPTPRQPPARLFGGTTLSDLGANKRIVARPSVSKDKDKAREEDPVVRRAREVMLHLPRSEGSANRNGKGKEKVKTSDGAFKVPELPAKARRKQGDTGTDVFGAVELPLPQSLNSNGKCKAGDGKTGDMIEEENKRVLKKLTMLHLASVGMPRSHDEFKEVFGFVYRGASFALRSQLKTMHVSALAAESIVEAHVRLYVSSDGAHDPDGSQVKTSSNTMDIDDAGG